MNEIGIDLFNDAPNTDTKIPILKPMAINIPCKTKLMFNVLVLIINSEIYPPITVRVQSKFANAATCKTLENLFKVYHATKGSRKQVSLKIQMQ